MQNYGDRNLDNETPGSDMCRHRRNTTKKCNNIAGRTEENKYGNKFGEDISSGSNRRRKKHRENTETSETFQLRGKMRKAL